MIISDTAGPLLKAIEFSSLKHRDQRRKDETKSPYINHPIAVTQRLWDVGGVRDLSTLISAILHDTLEDTQTTPDEINNLFGSEVLSIVLEVTDDKTLPKQMRKQLQIEHAHGISNQAKLVKLSDKSCNLHDLIYFPPVDWSLDRKIDYLLWTEKVVSQLKGTHPGLENDFDEILMSGKKIFDIF